MLYLNLELFVRDKPHPRFLEASFSLQGYTSRERATKLKLDQFRFEEIKNERYKSIRSSRQVAKEKKIFFLPKKERKDWDFCFHNFNQNPRLQKPFEEGRATTTKMLDFELESLHSNIPTHEISNLFFNLRGRMRAEKEQAEAFLSLSLLL